ncbi:MAG: hypothetical protein Q9227_003876 [Pyrenula ochraceoflavens]
MVDEGWTPPTETNTKPGSRPSDHSTIESTRGSQTKEHLPRDLSDAAASPERENTMPITAATQSPAGSATVDVFDKEKENSNIEEKTASKFGLFKLRPSEDDEPQDWWFASTAIPLIAATIGPMANVMSIAALVTSWRSRVVQPDPVAQSYATSVGYSDPHWCIALNIASLVCGFVGNLFLLFNFTKAVRYIIALPTTILLWYAATGILTGITICMNKYAPPGEHDVYSQGFWHAIIAACRGLVFPYSVGGIIILGLMVSSIHRFAGELGHDKVVQQHVNRRRQMTLKRSITITEDGDVEKQLQNGVVPTISSPSNPRKLGPRNRTIKFESSNASNSPEHAGPGPLKRRSKTFRKTIKMVKTPLRNRKPKVVVMREEKDRFNAMRDIQRASAKFKKWYALGFSVMAFGILWCIGAVVFWQAEKVTQQLSYFQALYFCYVSLLTIGYGDLSPKSNAGKPFFIVWSLIAVPTMTILISDMGDTVIAAFKKGTFRLADWTILPKKGIYRAFMLKNPWFWNWLQSIAEKRRVKKGFQTGFEEDDFKAPSLEDLARQETMTEGELTRQLAFAIRRTAGDLMHKSSIRYSYEDWVEFTRLIRFTSGEDLEEDEEENGVVNWDWIGDDSPMLSEQSETEWVLDRLCESLLRLLKKERVRNRLDVAPEEVGMSQRLGATSVRPGAAQQQGKTIDGSQRHIVQTKAEESVKGTLDREEEYTARSRRSSYSLDPMHRGIGPFPELDTTPQPSPNLSPPLRPGLFDRRRSSGVATTGSGDHSRSSLNERRRSSVGIQSPRVTSPHARKGPFRSLTTTRARGDSAFRTLKHRTYVND